jgi:hypothetical protein
MWYNCIIKKEVITMDYELIFWCVIGAFCLIAFIGMALAPHDEPVSESTLKRLRGERTH